MNQYPNYRVSVELVLEYNGKVFLTKRAPSSDIAPGVWCVPAGKVKYEEVPQAAAIREFKEEAGIDVQLVSELSCRAGRIKAKGEDAYRLFFTYLVKPASPDQLDKITLNDEHSECAWVDANDLHNPEYASLHDTLREIILGRVLANKS